MKPENLQKLASARTVIAEIGTRMGADVVQRCFALFAPEQDVLAAGHAPAAADLAYGPHPRHRLDIYRATDRVMRPLPVLVWVHGGGFVRGEKSSSEHPFNAHVGRWATRYGMLGVVMNYRLAPEAQWPSGGEDVGLVVDWLREHVNAYGGDPDRIILFGTSAGAAHIVTCLRMRAAMPGVCGAALLSGIYGATELEEPDLLYFGTDTRNHDWSRTLDSVAGCDVPLLLACAQYDLPRFQNEMLALMQAVLAARGRMPRAYIASGHNHYSLAMHIGSADTRLAYEVLDFVNEQVNTET